jgi:hypothetical protein
MSAQPAEVTELLQPPQPARPVAGGQQLRTERRAEKARERRVRRRWAVLSVAILGGSFGLTVGILDVLR